MYRFGAHCRIGIDTEIDIRPICINRYQFDIFSMDDFSLGRTVRVRLVVLCVLADFYLITKDLERSYILNKTPLDALKRLSNLTLLSEMWEISKKLKPWQRDTMCPTQWQTSRRIDIGSISLTRFQYFVGEFCDSPSVGFRNIRPGQDLIVRVGFLSRHIFFTLIDISGCDLM